MIRRFPLQLMAVDNSSASVSELLGYVSIVSLGEDADSSGLSKISNALLGGLLILETDEGVSSVGWLTLLGIWVH